MSLLAKEVTKIIPLTHWLFTQIEHTACYVNIVAAKRFNFSYDNSLKIENCRQSNGSTSAL